MLRSMVARFIEPAGGALLLLVRPTTHESHERLNVRADRVRLHSVPARNIGMRASGPRLLLVLRAARKSDERRSGFVLEGVQLGPLCPPIKKMGGLGESLSFS